MNCEEADSTLRKSAPFTRLYVFVFKETSLFRWTILNCTLQIHENPAFVWISSLFSSLFYMWILCTSLLNSTHLSSFPWAFPGEQKLNKLRMSKKSPIHIITFIWLSLATEDHINECCLDNEIMCLTWFGGVKYILRGQAPKASAFFFDDFVHLGRCICLNLI